MALFYQIHLIDLMCNPSGAYAAEACVNEKSFATTGDIETMVARNHPEIVRPNDFPQRIGRVLKAARWPKSRARVNGRPTRIFKRPNG